MTMRFSDRFLFSEVHNWEHDPKIKICYLFITQEAYNEFVNMTNIVGGPESLLSYEHSIPTILSIRALGIEPNKWELVIRDGFYKKQIDHPYSDEFFESFEEAIEAGKKYISGE